MSAFVDIGFGQILLKGIAFLAVCFIGYLLWLRIQEKRRERKARKERERERRGHWGYE